MRDRADTFRYEGFGLSARIHRHASEMYEFLRRLGESDTGPMGAEARALLARIEAPK